MDECNDLRDFAEGQTVIARQSESKHLQNSRPNQVFPVCSGQPVNW